MVLVMSHILFNKRLASSLIDCSWSEVVDLVYHPYEVDCLPYLQVSLLDGSLHRLSVYDLLDRFFTDRLRRSDSCKLSCFDLWDGELFTAFPSRPLSDADFYSLEVLSSPHGPVATCTCPDYVAQRFVFGYYSRCKHGFALAKQRTLFNVFHCFPDIVESLNASQFALVA